MNEIYPYLEHIKLQFASGDREVCGHDRNGAKVKWRAKDLSKIGAKKWQENGTA